MAERSKGFNYAQTGIGSCGHIVSMWPCGRFNGERRLRVICDTCTEEKYGPYTHDGSLSIWVYVIEDDKPLPRKPRNAAPKSKVNIWDSFL